MPVIDDAAIKALCQGFDDLSDLELSDDEVAPLPKVLVSTHGCGTVTFR